MGACDKHCWLDANCPTLAGGKGLGLTSAQAARLLGVSPDTLADWRKRGMLAHHKIPGANGSFSYWYPLEALQAFERATYVSEWAAGNP